MIKLVLQFVGLSIFTASASAIECYHCTTAGLSETLFRIRGFRNMPPQVDTVCEQPEMGLTPKEQCASENSPCVEILLHRDIDKQYHVRGCQDFVIGTITGEYCENGRSEGFKSFDQVRVCNRDICNDQTDVATDCNEKSRVTMCTTCESTGMPCNSSSPGASVCQGNWCFDNHLLVTPTDKEQTDIYTKGCSGINPFQADKCDHQAWQSSSDRKMDNTICYSNKDRKSSGSTTVSGDQYYLFLLMTAAALAQMANLY